MAPKFKAWSVGSSSTDSSDEETISREDGGPQSIMEDKGRPKRCGASNPSRPKSENVARQNATNFQLPNLQPHQHSALFYLSLIEGRCRTQAANSINAARMSDEKLPEDHPEVCELAGHLFTEMSRELSKAGVLPAEFAGSELAELRAGYLSSFDQVLDSFASKRSHEISESPQAAKQTLDLVQQAGTTPPYLGLSQVLARTKFAIMQYPNDTLGAVTVLGRQSFHLFDKYSDKAYLGRGASGKVVKAKHPLDGRYYAVKLIEVAMKKDRPRLDKVVEEVRGLARLDHCNVVRYFNSWYEGSSTPSYQTSKDQKAIDIPGLDAQTDGKSQSDGDSQSDQESQPDGKSQSNTDFVVSFAESHGQESRNISQATSNLWIGTQVTTSSAPGETSHEASTSESDGESSPQGFYQPARDAPSKLDNTRSSMGVAVASKRQLLNSQVDQGPSYKIYIQMALYDGSLKNYLPLDDPKPKSLLQLCHCYHKLPSIRILKCILEGVEYCHSQGIVHRDLKPDNILLSVNQRGSKSNTQGSTDVTDCPDCSGSRPPTYLTPCLADFGLMAKISDDATPPVSLDTDIYEPCLFAKEVAPKVNVNQVGTVFYRAPPTSVICPKMDVYSLGVIAFELLYKFGTRSERAIKLDALGKGQFPDNFPSEFVPGIKAMVHPDRENRWDCERVRRWLEEMEEREEVVEEEYVQNGS